EYRRLLYVAMTRAADRLIVAGIQPANRNGVRDQCWYDLIGKGLQSSGLLEETIETADGAIKRYFRSEDAAPAAGPAATETPSARRELPQWLRVPVAASTSNGHFLRPSDSAGAAIRKARSGESAEQRSRALQRGTLVHRLLQSLPDLAADRRHEAALNFLTRNAGGWSKAGREMLAESGLGLVVDPGFAAVFAEGSRAEVAIVGRLDLPERPQTLISGQIDRLAVTPGEVLIVDFKTNHAPPKAAAEAP